MIFSFLKYIKPIWYFNLRQKNGSVVFPDPSQLPKEVLLHCKQHTFEGKEAIAADLSWQAFQKGYIGRESFPYFGVKHSIKDEYRFIRTYFKKVWALYILAIRLITLKNPIRELNAFWATRKVAYENVFANPIPYKNWKLFKSELVAEQPKVSVIIPTLNRYEYLKDVLEDLEKQAYKNFEVLVVDQSVPFQKDFYNDFQLKIQVIHQEEKALWLARNTAIQKSDADWLLLFDDDSRVEKDWITNHLKCVDFFKASISSGVSISKIGDAVPENYSYFRISDQLDTGNVLISRKVFEVTGLFDRQFEKQRMGDGAFGLRAYLEGFLNISNPYGERLHLKVPSGGLRQMGSWDAFRPVNWWAPRPVPSVLYYYRMFYGTRKARLALVQTLPTSMVPYRLKKNKKWFPLAVLSAFIMAPILCIQAQRSWVKASKKLKQGALIPNLPE
ncbi:glycosyltransferase family 2 protein [Ascidiimonas sp. W6]|uniref:glycosyltransferase family 2 protein n=1 Tax=Ascidiimonas meishanensis TaxID=3128903 RepID=UPI0030EDC207